MEVQIKKIYKDSFIQPNFITHGNFQVFFPEIKMLLVGIGFSITEDGKLYVKVPMKYFYEKGEDGKQIEYRLPVVRFRKNKEVWENVKKALRKKLVAEMTASKKESEA